MTNKIIIHVVSSEKYETAASTRSAESLLFVNSIWLKMSEGFQSCRHRMAGFSSALFLRMVRDIV